MTRAEFEIPGSFPSVANLREHHMARARRAKRHRTTAGVLTAIAVPAVKPLVQARGGTVTLTRYAPRRLDSDNLAGALKATRDGIAAALGVDDGDPRVVWNYAQERCKGSESRVVAVVEAARERA
jgi:hypothetical protein